MAKVDTVMHFTDEIAVVEISTFRRHLILVIPEGYVATMELTADAGQIHLTKVE
jgi:hypothetical protein